MNNELSGKWSFIPATIMEIELWSSGPVESKEDLYSPAIFGHTSASECACGTRRAVGDFCPKCKVIIQEDPVTARKRLLGAIRFPEIIENPLVMQSRISDPYRMLTETFPIAPISYRLNEDGKPNEIGLKYERLVEENARFSATAKGAYSMRPKEACAGVQQIIRDIVGLDASGNMIAANNMADGTLLGLLFKALCRHDPNLDAIARSCALTLQLSARI